IKQELALSRDQLQLLSQRLEQPRKPPERLALPTGEGLEFVEVASIVFCASESNYTHIHLENGEYLITRTLKDIQEALTGASFFRIHNRYLINLKHLDKYMRGDGGYVIMHDGRQLPVARSRKEELMHLIRTL
ncbi:MAG: LytTR family DNA-binding domain-containing protein, partial [Saprospiraceae bacterium]|nr:LytTR family DNA-binding domain-containing protein [Saprospiraceae bacterium]